MSVRNADGGKFPIAEALISQYEDDLTAGHADAGKRAAKAAQKALHHLRSQAEAQMSPLQIFHSRLRRLLTGWRLEHRPR